VPEEPETRYARSGDLHIAYQVVGEGPLDLMWVPTWIWHLEHAWEERSVRRLFERLAEFARVILFDRRGSGLSDPVAGAPALEEQMDDVVAVMDAVGAERVALLAQFEAGAMACLFAATHPERTSALILYEAMARMTAEPGYDWALTREERAGYEERLRADWGSGARVAGLMPPEKDPERLRWAARLERFAASPGTAAALYRMQGEVDVRPVLGSIQSPTLVLHRPGDRMIDIRHSRYLAEHIPGARLVELPGTSAAPFAGNQELLIGEIEEFLTGSRHDPDPERVLATVMFSDIVDSTRRAAELGDQRWRTLLQDVERSVFEQLGRHRGRAVKSLGDGFLATFDGPARAIRCAATIRDTARSRFGLEVRSGVHTGEIELIGSDVGGIAVHIGARVSSAAAPGEVLVSGTVKDLVVGSGITFEDRGERQLKGVPGSWRLWAVTG
jgi:class 3 adenylate cyclase/pimeloyl-ACP methyl ester carboxylesterase